MERANEDLFDRLNRGEVVPCPQGWLDVIARTRDIHVMNRRIIEQQDGAEHTRITACALLGLEPLGNSAVMAGDSKSTVFGFQFIFTKFDVDASIDIRDLRNDRVLIHIVFAPTEAESNITIMLKVTTSKEASEISSRLGGWKAQIIAAVVDGPSIRTLVAADILDTFSEQSHFDIVALPGVVMPVFVGRDNFPCEFVSWNGERTAGLAQARIERRAGFASFHSILSSRDSDRRLLGTPLQEWPEPVWAISISASRQDSR